ncbi:TonB-dependent receptor [Pseudopedobacter saltans DSM 12145]|uniref:TonB-dependent receptor n=1 Tax=Pseudopedobacter saltans (strain ATCC 51119 / DSM 12145 / JCM 21818 / CCUG 39354 / LMG 10337 / NBRC 100064 / NCIMB 13643) TaxID=762903 RepID=F0S5E4_PSESL|nr:SusC/RagA family TonB-linked outer membrane protein [Pseudopedobacter saltans]ADY53108.1 TonB-dependent receptor [Pseudopedobacter saltans DSM 12145]
MKRIIGIAICLTVTSGLYGVSSAKAAFNKDKISSNHKTNAGISPNNILTQDSILKGNDSDSLVQVAFRKVKKEDLLGGVSVLNFSELMENNYATYSLENLEALTSGFHGNIWGNSSYLVLVDGFPRDANNIMPTEIDQITVMKGVGAVALYGSKAAKGVVYITTKRGGNYDQKVNVRANAGINVPKVYPQYLGSAEYMTLYNEARRNDGLANLYTESEIYNYGAGLNPFRYPNINFYSSDYLKDSYNRYDVTTEISGGNEKAQYYTNMGFWTNDALLNFGEATKSRGANRFNLRGNINMRLNNIIKLNVDASASFYTGRGVNADFWGSAATVRPNRFSPLIPISMIEEGDDPSMIYVNNSNYIINGQYLLGGTQLDQTNVFASIYAGGSNKNINRQFQFNTGVDFDLKGITQGLAFKTNLAIDYLTSFTQSFNNNYATYQANWNNYAGFDQISNLIKYGDDSKSGVENISNSYYRQNLAFSGQLAYNRTFNKVHNVSGSLLGYAFQIGESQIYQKNNNTNLGLNFGYNFNQKYYADFSSAYVYSTRLPEGKRTAFSPTLSLGWRISQENFLKDVDAIDNLKLTASAGILNTDLDITGYYLYQGYYTYNDAAWYSWKDGQLVHSFDRRRGNNFDMAFPQRREISFGLEGSFFKNLIDLSANAFFSETKGNIVQPGALFPIYFSTGWPVYSDIPYVNYDSDSRKGFDFSLNFNRKLGEVAWRLGFNGTYYRTEAKIRASDSQFEYDYQYRSGRPIDAIFGLQNEGFFMDGNDIANSPDQSAFGEIKPGDLKYKDQNGDGIIDSRDEIYLGRAGWYGAPLTLGVNLTAKWKNFTVFALATGRFGAKAIKNSSYFWVDGQDKYSIVVRDRWTEETKDTATFPRLTTGTSDNNYRNSDFWLYNTNRFDLAKVQLSYQFPTKMLGKGFIRELGAYVNGFNLLTIAEEREILEMNIGLSPQTRFYNLGLKALF